MTYTVLVKYLSTRCQILVNRCQILVNSFRLLSTPCQILVNSCQPAVKFLSNFYAYKKHLSNICQLDFLVYSPI